VIGLPSLRALDGAPGPRIWLAAEATDMRCVRIPVKWATDSGDVGQGRSEATLVVFLH
jgi:hypothetical protein